MSRILIIGAGIVGLSIARAAILRGHSVRVLEQGAAPNPQSASHDRHRMIRYPYGAAAGYTRMVTDAFGAWDRLWADLGRCHFENTGAIAISLEPGDYAEKTLATFRAVGLPHEVLDRAGVEALLPHLTLPQGAWGVTAFPGGPLFAADIVADLVRWLKGRGVEIETQCRVTEIDEAAGLVRRADGQIATGDIVIVAAGAWLPRLMPARYGQVPVYRQALVYVTPPPAHETSWREAPAIAALGDHTGYTLPDRRGAGLKIGYSAHRRPAMPDVEGFAADLVSESQAILGAFRPYFRDFEAYRPERMQVGYYTLDPSRRFLFARHDRTVVITNCDGQMFKFGPLIGERMLDMIEGRQSFTDLAQWAAGS
jgi:sarcosine oxidase